MNINEIDEIIIKGLKESERRNEIFVNQAKPRVWEAIGRPKRRKTVNWWFVSAMAAAISLFLISTILFLKLESQKKELLALKTYSSNEIKPIEFTNKKVIPDEEPIIEKNSTVNQESITIALIDKTIPEVQRHDLEEEVEVDIKNPDPINASKNKTMMIVSKPEIEIPEIFHQELKTQVVQIPEVNEETFLEPKSKKQGKLKFKIGNSSKVQDYSTIYAINIKL